MLRGSVFGVGHKLGNGDIGVLIGTSNTWVQIRSLVE